MESGKAILGQGAGLSKATEAGKYGAQVGDREYGGSTRQARTLQSRGQWTELQEALNLALNPHWLWDIGPLSLTILTCKRGIIVIPDSQG